MLLNLTGLCVQADNPAIYKVADMSTQPELTDFTEFSCTFTSCLHSAPEWNGQVLQRPRQPAVRQHVFRPAQTGPATQRCLAQTGLPESPPNSISQPAQPEEPGLP